MRKCDFQNVLAAIFYITVITVLFSCLGPRTRVHIDEDDIPDKTLTIIVETEMDNETAYHKIEQLLTRRGYTFRSDIEIIDGIPPDFSGVAERIDPENVYIQLGIGIRGELDAEITIQGWYMARDYEGRPAEVEQRIIIIREGFGGSIEREAWIEMFAVASELGGFMRFEQE
jgi:hypothetical protein